MGVLVAATTATSVAANTKSANLVSSTYEFLPFDAEITVAARASATGMNLQVFGAGTALVNDLPISFTGTAGGISILDHQIASFTLPEGSRIEAYLRNTTAGALTGDLLIQADEV